MPRSWVALCLFIVLCSCGETKAPLNGDMPVSAKDFFNAFSPLSSGFIAADSNIHKIADTTTISYTVFSQFVPDSILQKLIGKNTEEYVIDPVGKIEKAEEIYILANFNRNKRTFLITFLFDKKHRFLSAIELLNSAKDDGYKHSVSINGEPTFLLTREKTTSNNHYFYTKNAYAYSKDAKGFILVVNDSNEDVAKINEIINPIDTLPHRNKFSGDYAQDKRNFISIRDGENANDYVFFIHFEKNNAQCNGELKGEMKTIAKNKAVYSENGDPCVINFTFDDASVYVKEEGSCGNHRGITCYFDDTYQKVKSKKKLKKKEIE